MSIININGRNYKVTGNYPKKYVKTLIPIGIEHVETLTYSTNSILENFSKSMLISMFEAQKTNQVITMFIGMLQIKTSFMNNEEWFIAGINELVTLSIITQKQADSYLSFT